MDAETASMIARTYTATEITRQIDRFEELRNEAAGDAEEVDNLTDALATLREARLIQAQALAA